MTAADVAARVIPLIDATNLADDCTEDDVVALCRSASGPWGSVAGVCIFPQFVTLARRELDAAAGDDAASAVRLVTVTNFPSGEEDSDAVVTATRRALDDGADEIDVVLPYQRLLAGDLDAPARLVDAVRAAVPTDRTLKVIIESGALTNRAQVDAAARLAVEHGADFVKTSTGKSDVSATPEAVESILGVLSTAPRQVGVKVAGGVRSLADAAGYLELADRVMGGGWVRPEAFRFGSSSLLATALDAVEPGSEETSQDEHASAEETAKPDVATPS